MSLQHMTRQDVGLRDCGNLACGFIDGAPHSPLAAPFMLAEEAEPLPERHILLAVLAGETRPLGVGAAPWTGRSRDCAAPEGSALAHFAHTPRVNPTGPKLFDSLQSTKLSLLQQGKA
jgi:hypothetical protein